MGSLPEYSMLRAGLGRRQLLRMAGLSAAAVGGLGLAQTGTADASQLINLATGADYEVSVAAPDEATQQTQESSYPDNGKLLTDGNLAAGSQYTDEGWVGYLRQFGRTVEVDLGQVNTVHTLSLGFLFDSGAAIYLPDQVHASLSLDNEHWFDAGTSPGDNTGTAADRRSVVVRVQPTYARFVRLTFDVTVWCFVEEIKVTGQRGRAHGGRPPHGTPTPVPGSTDFLRQGTRRVGGVQNMFLAYTYDTRSGNADVGRWSAEDFAPVLSYITGGRSRDRMWDTVLFVAGGAQTDYADKAGWEDLLDRLFEPGTNIDALDAAASRLRGSGRGGHRARVVLPIPYPLTDSEQPWGELDGRVLDFNPERVGADAAGANRLLVVRWFVDELVRRYHAKRRARLDFAGLYWMEERIVPRSENAELARRTADHVHALPGDLKFYWIPYFEAYGYQSWQSFGFDASMLQPNYFFTSTLPSTDTYRLEYAAELARLSGQGVELEIDDAAVTSADARQKWFNYLDVDHRVGADRAIKGYYWGSRTTFEQMASSSDPEVRRTYDRAYEFIAASRR